MKRSLSLLVTMGFLLVISSGCATRDYVRQQIEPLLDRVSKAEAMAQEAKKTAEECCEKSEGAANRAEEAAKKAEAAAEKAKKSFELQQRK